MNNVTRARSAGPPQRSVAHRIRPLRSSSLTRAIYVDKVQQVAFRPGFWQTSDNVSEGSCDTADTVLHIRSRSDDFACADEMTARLASTQLIVDTCPDVYRGLARICTAPEGTHRAVIVCLDDAGSAELEFFSVVARARPEVPVYIYGDAAGAGREARAIELGAAGVLTDNVIRDLGVREDRSMTDVSDEQPLQFDDESASPCDDERTTASSMEAGATPTPDDDAGDPEYDDPGGPVQVPWVSRADGPVRRGPQRQRSGEGESPRVQDADALPAHRDLHEPLLTDEELRALIGDDILPVNSDEQTAPGDAHIEDNGGRP